MVSTARPHTPRTSFTSRPSAWPVGCVLSRKLPTALQLPGVEQTTEWTSLFWIEPDAPVGRVTALARCHTPFTSLATKLWPLLCVSWKAPTAAQLPADAHETELIVSEGSALADVGGSSLVGAFQIPFTSFN